MKKDFKAEEKRALFAIIYGGNRKLRDRFRRNLGAERWNKIRRRFHRLKRTIRNSSMRIAFEKFYGPLVEKQGGQ
jgi:hypothetical protein